jgi:thioredoxin reductase (NADPH)
MTSLQPPTPTVIGASWCPDCRRTKSFPDEPRITYEWNDLNTRPEATVLLEGLTGGSRIIPTVVFPDGSHLAEPGNDELADKLGLTRVAWEPMYDLIIIGSGPTGITTSIYAARENSSVLIIEKSAFRGQARVTEYLDNYPGFPDGVAGRVRRSLLPRRRGGRRHWRWKQRTRGGTIPHAIRGARGGRGVLRTSRRQSALAGQRCSNTSR